MVLTAKAEMEMDRDGLTRQNVIESILSADRIAQRIRSRNPATSRRETLYVIDSTTWDGMRIYTKGKIVSEHHESRFYVLVSSKNSVPR